MKHALSRRNAIAGLIAYVASVAAPSLRAQPAGMARIVIGSGPGSAIDNLARRVAEKLQPAYAATVIVENKTGAWRQA